MPEVPFRCPIKDYCGVINRRELPMKNDEKREGFADKFRSSYLTNRQETQTCWLMNLHRCKLDPLSWVDLGKDAQDYLWEIADPLEHFGDLDN